ncbi:hypothetical protein KC19_1G305500 [Ceratodon purpureus]|uniref:Uncharacterized protein n=1 Tax=Ceratodon purpureus TaxID=3225 RepID=A0A8T0JB21_CERPU|nr:hypothetical protein KC19_1G305500 [Ceratodon purpureus]
MHPHRHSQCPIPTTHHIPPQHNKVLHLDRPQMHPKLTTTKSPNATNSRIPHTPQTIQQLVPSRLNPDANPTNAPLELRGILPVAIHSFHSPLNPTQKQKQPENPTHNTNPQVIPLLQVPIFQLHHLEQQ